MRLPGEIEKARHEIEAHAREYGLDFYDVEFEVLDYDQLNEVASYGGFPTRYPHWRFGMEYEELSKSYSYGLSKIYELVINNNPVYAYLMKSNGTTEQKLVMAHVFGHADFFKNNLWFSKTNRRMIDEMANHATRVRSYIDRFGLENVEGFVDACLSLENLIDPHADFIERQERRDWRAPEPEPEEAQRVPRLRSKGYMESYINPPEFIEAQKAKIAERAKRKRKLPAEPQRDVLQFLIDHAPLENWERDILSIVREEAYYFAPQAMTKILNEGWACVHADTLVFTDRGLVTMRELVESRQDALVCDGAGSRAVYDRHVIRDHAAVTVRTALGLSLTGSNNHRVLLADGATWKRLDALAAGDRLRVSGGQGLWPAEEARLEWAPVVRRAPAHGLVGAAATALAAQEGDAGRTVEAHRRPVIRVPDRVTPELGAFLGYLVGSGYVSRAHHRQGVACADHDAAVSFARIGTALFGVPALIRHDSTAWRVTLASEPLTDLLLFGLGVSHAAGSSERALPDAVRRSPAAVAAAFLRALFDGEAETDASGVVLTTTSARLAEQTQILLLNLGVISGRVALADGGQVRISGASAAAFAREVGFGTTRKRDALAAYLAAPEAGAPQPWEDEVVAVETGRADVYDISVADTHRYAAGGFVNHNSYWHSTIMTQRALTDAEVIDFADSHAGTLAMQPGRLNPYKIGIELFREIENRWNKGRFGKEWEECDDVEVRKRWDRKLGMGRQKIFVVRKIYNDVMFIDAFMDEDFCERLKLFVYGYDTRSGQHVIVDRDWRKVKQRLLFSLTNAGQPIIHVVESNYSNRGELYLKHRFEGIPLDQEKGRDTLKNLQRLWHRPVHIETIADDRALLLSFDGTDHKSTWI